MIFNGPPSIVNVGARAPSMFRRDIAKGFGTKIPISVAVIPARAGEHPWPRGHE